MTGERPDWLVVERRDAPLIVSIPHAGTDLVDVRTGFRRSVARAQGRRLAARRALRFCRAARRDNGANAAFALDHRRQSRPERRFALSRQATTELVPTTTFDGEPLYRPGQAPDAAEIAERRRLYFDPYHAALAGEIARLRQTHQRVALFDAHSIRSRIPRLFDGELPVFNLGTNSGASCDPGLRETVGALLAASGQTSIVDGRFKGGWITRAYGRPGEGVEALQLELACRGYMQEPERPAPENWPTPIDEGRAAPTRATIKRVLEAMLSQVSRSMKTTACCHSRRNRSERSGIQHRSRAMAATLDPRSDLRSAEDDTFLED